MSRPLALLSWTMRVCFRIHACGRHVLWIPDSDKQLQVRLMICAHMRDAGHRGVAATLVRLQEFYVWSGMEAQMREFVRQCLHCADTRSGDVVPRPLGETVHGTAPNEVCLLYTSPSPRDKRQSRMPSSA